MIAQRHDFDNEFPISNSQFPMNFQCRNFQTAIMILKRELLDLGNP